MKLWKNRKRPNDNTPNKRNYRSKIKADYNKWPKKILVPPCITVGEMCGCDLLWACETVMLVPSIELNYILMNQFGIETIFAYYWHVYEVWCFSISLLFGWARNEPIRPNISNSFYLFGRSLARLPDQSSIRSRTSQLFSMCIKCNNTNRLRMRNVTMHFGSCQSAIWIRSRKLHSECDACVLMMMMMPVLCLALNIFSSHRFL